MPDRPPKLLFDENLAGHLVSDLAPDFPDSQHVRSVGLAPAADRAIWDYARQHGFVLVTKDEDFQQLSVLEGPPPKVIWIRLGNCSTSDVMRILRMRRSEIKRFVADTEAAFLALA